MLQRRKETANVMEPDGFGFDSSVNYIGNSPTQMNSPSVKQAISLSPTEKSKATSTASLWTSKGAVLFSAKHKNELVDQDEWAKSWLNEWVVEIELRRMKKEAGITFAEKPQNSMEGSLLQIYILCLALIF